MTERIIATSEVGLNEINDAIHDAWFDVQDVSFDATAAVLTVRFRRSPLPADATGGEPECALRVGSVESYDVQDSEGIRRYDFNVIKYDPDQRMLTVLTGIPCVFWAQVNSLQVELTCN